MIKNTQDSEVLVYIRRVSEGSQGVGGIIGQWDYYQMAALPTRDNPRYQISGDDTNQDILTSYYYKFDTFSDKIKIQVGPYDVTTGVLCQAYWYWTEGGSGSYYQYEYLGLIGTGEINPTGYSYITVPSSALSHADSKVTLDFKSVRQDITPEEISLMTSQQFNSFPPIYYINDIPKLVPQTGLISIYDDFGDYIKPYQLTYNINKSLIERSLESLQTTAPIPLIQKGDEADQTVGYTSKVVETINDPKVRSQDGTTFEKRRLVGVQSRTIPLHEISNKTEGVQCKSTHLAYRVGSVDKETPYEYWNGEKITHDYQPCVYLFNNHGSFYKRLPECWPWSCRRHTVESVLDTGTNKNKIKYFTQDEITANKIETTYDKIPSLNIEFLSFLNDTDSVSPKFLNSPPSDANIENKDYINGYYFFESELKNISEDSHAVQCGCDPNDEKITMALEMFPLLDKSLCKLVAKVGFLCYPTKDCTVPNLGHAYKKIIYPFNSCIFNEEIKIFPKKMSSPPVTLDSNQVIFESTGDDKVLLSYVLLGRKYFTDPYYHPSGVTQQLSESVTVPMDVYNDTLVAVFRYPCMYSTNIYVYEYSDNYIEKIDEYTFDALYDCPSGTLLSVNIHNSYDKKTGADLNSRGGLNNTCDPPYKAEYYRTLSLGNAKGYIDVQEQCCEYCREAQEDGKVRFFANPNCFSLDVEATSSSVDHFKQAGNCKIDDRTPCNNTVIMGRAKLDAIVRFIAETPSDALIVEGEFEPSGFIMFYSSGYLNNEANVIGSGYNMIAGEVSAMTAELIAYFEGYTV